jgi:transposase
MNKCTINETHCEECGSTRVEHVENLQDTQGYSRCCNERVVDAGSHCRAFHAERN